MKPGKWWLVRWAWYLVWYRWLSDDYYKTRWFPIHVKGWRTALCGNGRNNGMRRNITPCFWWFD